MACLLDSLHNSGMYAANSRSRTTATAATACYPTKKRDTRIFCYDCQTYTNTEEPIFFKRLDKDRFHIAGICANCKTTKAKHYCDVYFKQFPKVLYNAPIFKIYLNRIGEISLSEELEFILNR